MVTQCVNVFATLSVVVCHIFRPSEKFCSLVLDIHDWIYSSATFLSRILFSLCRVTPSALPSLSFFFYLTHPADLTVVPGGERQGERDRAIRQNSRGGVVQLLLRFRRCPLREDAATWLDV